MVNAMDKIVVRFGAKRISFEERMAIERAKSRLKQLESEPSISLMSVIKKQKKELQKIIKKDSKFKELPLCEFLNLKFKDLSPIERKLQISLRFLHKQNQETPLFKQFPDRDEQLFIDCTTEAMMLAGGSFFGGMNMVVVGNKPMKEDDLVEVLAHELKHAEQWISPEEKATFNNYQYHQISFLKEAQAYAAGKHARFLFEKRLYNFLENENPEIKVLLSLFGEEKGIDGLIESTSPKHIVDHLNSFFDKEEYVNTYKDTYDERHPILFSDKALTRIPSVFGIDKKDEVKVLNVLNKRVPKQARTPDNQFFQAVENQRFDKVEQLASAKNKDGSYFVSNEIFSQYLMCYCHDNLKLFNAMLNTGRVSGDDLKMVFMSVFHFSPDEEITPGSLLERQNIFDLAVAAKDKKGRFLISAEDIHDIIEFSEVMEGEKIKPLLEHANACLKKRTAPVKKRKNEGNSPV